MPLPHLLRGVILSIAVVAVLGALLTTGDADAAVNRTYVVLLRGNAGGDGAVQKAGGSVVYSYHQIGVVIARSASPSFAANLGKNNRVEGVSATEGFAVRLEPDAAADAALAAAAVANANGFPADNLGNLQWDMVQINVPQAHETEDGASSVVVGDIDTGLDYQHPDLAANIDFSKSVSCESGAPDQTPAAWDDHNGHGTHTAGTIAAAANGIGIVGVAPGVKIAGIKSSNDDGFFLPEMVICSFMWAATHGIHVTNNSYFADPWLFNCRNDHEQHAIWKAEQRAIRYAISQGVTVVASMGNNNMDLSKKNTDTISPDFPPGNEQTREVTNACVVVPNEVPGVIGVAANGPTGNKSFYSNYGVGVTEVVAPGGDSTQAPNPFGRVISTLPADSAIYAGLPASRKVVDPDDGSTYGYLQGTSMAGPHAAGVAALILSAYGPMNPGHVAALLEQTADEKPCPPNPYEPLPGMVAPAICRGGTGYNGFYGHGEVNAEAAVTK